tara:strand:+ start:16 stop:192 length:177 start_codon:yes stop_codon:yes gene_type:complete
MAKKKAKKKTNDSCCKPSRKQLITIAAVTVLGVIFLGLIIGIALGAVTGGVVWALNKK